MSATAFTPGPLLARRINDTAKPFAVINPAGPHGDEIVAGYLREGDAALYAAAPDLLAVAKECLELAKLAESLCGCRGDDDYVWGIQERLNAALAKAEVQP